MLTAQQIEENRQIDIANLAEKYLSEALLEHEPFTEGLCNWATHKAEQEIG